jgi:hypothetical protein
MPDINYTMYSSDECKLLVVTAVLFILQSFVLRNHVVWWTRTNVSNGYTTAIFKDSFLKREAAYSFETLVSTQKTTAWSLSPNVHNI